MTIPPAPGIPATEPGPDTLGEPGRPALTATGWAVRGVWRNRHVTIPLAFPAALYLTGHYLSRHSLGYPTLLAAIAAGFVVFVTAPGKWSSSPRWRGYRWATEVTYARATALGAGTWLAITAYSQPPSPDLTWALALGAVPWGVLFYWHKRPRGVRERRRAEREHAAQVQRWAQWWQVHSGPWGFPGSHVTDVRLNAGLKSVLVQLVPGRQAGAAVKHIIPLIESALRDTVKAGTTRVEHPAVVDGAKDPSMVWIHLKQDEPLAEEIVWDDTMAPASIREPAPLAVRETGGWLREILRRSMFILGRTRWGKSNELSVMLATVTRCRDARPWLIDRKGGRATRPWLPALDWAAVELSEIRLILALACAEIKARSTYCTTGQEQLDPTDDVPTLFVILDEAYEVTGEAAGDADCARDLAVIASQGQGVEVYTWVLSQYGALPETVRTEQTRMNLNTRLCFQTEHRDHGTFALGDDAYVVDTTKLAVKGAFYYRADAKTHLMQVRGPHLPHPVARAIAERNAHATGIHERPLVLYCGNQPCPLVPGKTWQQVYDERWGRLPGPFRGDAPQAAGAPSPAPSKITNARRVPADVAAAVAQINDEADQYPVTEDDVAEAARLRAERGAPPLDLRTEWDQRRHQFAILLQRAGDQGLGASQLKEAAGVSRSWASPMLGKLAGRGVLIRVGNGKYRPAPGADVWEAMEAMRAEDDTLGQEAWRLVGAPS